MGPLVTAFDIDVVVRSLERTFIDKGDDYLEKIVEYLQDYTQKDILSRISPPIITALFCIGDQLLLRSDEPQGILDFGNDIRISRLIHQLLHRLNEQTRFEIAYAAIQEGSAIYVIVHETAI